MSPRNRARARSAALAAAICTIGVEKPLSAGGQSAMQAPKLTNAHIEAEFGARGLVSLTDVANGRTHTFVADGFGVEVDGMRWESATLPDPARRAAAGRVVYAWDAGGYVLEVTYELEPGWRFLSKRLAVVAAPVPAYRLDEVTLFDARLGDAPAEVFVPSYERPDLQTGDYGGALRFAAGHGLLVVAQNPFLGVRSEGAAFSLRYAPAMEWRTSWGVYESDRGLLAPYGLTGRRLPQRMLPEWRLGERDATDGLDEAEIAAFTDLVRAFLLHPRERPTRVFVGWTANDYQIDVATPEGRAEYRRLLDRAAALGAEHVLYAPSNSALSRREESADDWRWEHVLWLGLGQRIRKGEWDVARDRVPPTVQDMLDYARSKDLKLLAYVYPVLPFAQNPEWLVTPAGPPDRRYASLGVRALQDWLIETLVTFQQRTGIGGYAFDHTFLGYEGTSRYAQWYGWRRVLEELRRRVPDIVIDGRQAYHLYGPWSWLAGSYPHPTYSDEQPESFVPFPDLHFDRVSANRERYTAYRFRNRDFAPSEIVPGFIGHQTPRLDDTGRMPSDAAADRGELLLPFRARDWDWLGWRYSLLSSIAVAGWNHVLNMIPARDPAEFEYFPPADAAWLLRWLDWADANREYLRHTRTILGQPALGKVDGTSAIVGGRGFVFLFNPNGRALEADFLLDASTGLEGSGPWLLEEIYPQGGRRIHRPGALYWMAGDRVSLEMDGGSALVLEIRPAPASRADPLLFGVAGAVRLQDKAVHIENARAEPGTSPTVQVALPPGREVTSLRVNGREVSFSVAAGGLLSADLRFDGVRFRQYQPVGRYDPAFTGGEWSGTFTIPQRIFAQLEERRRAWPIPWTSEDSLSTWLVPERLLLFVQVAEPDDSMAVEMRIDGAAVELKKAYSAVRAARRTFTGWYLDVSGLEADREYRVELVLPPLRAGQFQGLFFENVEPEYTPRIVATR